MAVGVSCPLIGAALSPAEIFVRSVDEVDADSGI